MNHFYIKSVIVTGIDHEPSIVEFSDGLNLVVGPSNSGKSHIMKCIDYMFGFAESAKHPFSFNMNWGYTHIKMVLETAHGTVILSRKIGEKTIDVSGTDTSISPGKYGVGNTKNSINSLWLKLVGIDDEHQVISKKSGDTQSLTWRSIMHLFFVPQGDAARTTSVLLGTHGVSPTPSQSSLLFLLTGQDAIKPPKEESKETKAARKDSVIAFIKKMLQRIEERIEELDKEQESHPLPDIEKQITAVNEAIAKIQTEIDSCVRQSKGLMQRIYEENGRVSEFNAILGSFDTLKAQYQIDIDRLAFILDGEQCEDPEIVLTQCPICHSAVPAHKHTSINQAARADLTHIASHLQELDKAYKDTLEKKTAVEKTVQELEGQRQQVDMYVAHTLSPQLHGLKHQIDEYRVCIQHAQEMETIKAEKTMYEVDLFEWENKPEETPQNSVDVTDGFTYGILEKLNSKVSEILKAIHFPGYASVRFDKDTFDFTIQDMPKDTTNGGGFCGVLNAAELLALREVLHEYGKHEIGILLLDSALTQLSESVHTGKGAVIRDGLIEYMIAHQDIGQIIMIEQRDKIPDWVVDSPKCKVIEFTKSREIGQWGFLNDVYEENT